jgi:broad specificity phosphatase PhoE
LVRHGEPAAYAHGRCYGRLDVRLSYRGREQIRLVARSLRQAPLVAVYTSPLRRAQESAAIVSCSHRIPVSVDERLSEINFGRFEGKTYDEVAESHPELYRAWKDRPTEVEFPGGESFDAME